MQIFLNPFRGKAAGPRLPPSIPFPIPGTATLHDLLARCPEARPTPLVAAPTLAARARVAAVYVKDERQRMGLGSFKALGGAYVIAHDAAATGADRLAGSLSGITYVTASAGNHGLSVAAGARIFGAKAIVHLSTGVSDTFARRLREQGAEVVRSGDDYEASVEAARQQAGTKGYRFLSDGSWEGYVEIPLRVMEGYTQLLSEVADTIPAPPTHIFVQAGVGGLAAAVAVAARDAWGAAPIIIVVEPVEAAALYESIRAGRAVNAPGLPSTMGRLDCKEPSLIALKGLARDADIFLTISDDEVAAELGAMRDAGLETTPSGGAGLAALLASAPVRDSLGLTEASLVLAVASEIAEPAA